MHKIIRNASYIFCGGVLVLLAAISACETRPKPTQSSTSTVTIPVTASIPTTSAQTPSNTAIRGIVVDLTGKPIAKAIVRVKATEQTAVTDSAGYFTLKNLAPGRAVILTAWASGYYNGGGKDEIMPGRDDVTLALSLYPSADNADYALVSAFSSAGQAGNCQNCHADPGNPSSVLPFDEWSHDVHALTAQNPRFLSMYRGTDLEGNQSPRTRYSLSRDYGRMPLPPDPSQPYYGPGYKLDFPETAGNCAACHLPAAAMNAAYAVDPFAAIGVGTEGVACDFCHKVLNVQLNPGSGLPYPNMPGVLSFEFRRPPEGHQFFAGPFDDVAPGEDTFSPLQKQSQFCAPCHFGVFWDTQIYNSFGEWLQSPYNNPETGKTCQDCHMPAGGTDHFARTDKGGQTRDPKTIFSHSMPGASSTDLLQNAVTMTAAASLDGDRLTVQVSITNDKTGHDVPTDSPLRQMILLVKATDGQGQVLALQDGTRVPDWGGVGDPAKGYYAGLPGKAYAKILMELWTEVTPTGAYWNPTRVISDNRLAAFSTDTSKYVFVPPADGRASIEVTLLYRRAFKLLADQKGWDVPDVVMAQQTIRVKK